MQPSDSPYGVSREEHDVQRIPQCLPVLRNLAHDARYSELLPSSGERIGYLSDPDFQMPVGHSDDVEDVADLTELADVEDVADLTELAELTPVQMLVNLDQVIQLCFHRFR